MAKPCVVKCEDGSTLIEFIDKDWRFGIVIDKNRKESSWYFVDKDRLNPEDFENNCGHLSEDFLKLLKDNL